MDAHGRQFGVNVVFLLHTRAVHQWTAQIEAEYGSPVAFMHVILDVEHDREAEEANADGWAYWKYGKYVTAYARLESGTFCVKQWYFSDFFDKGDTSMLVRTPKQRLAPLEVFAAPKPDARHIPVPTPAPASCVLPLSVIVGDDAIKGIVDAKQLVFHAVGDTGGVNGTVVQDAVAQRMETQPVDFGYLLGDVVYYNGISLLYPYQFYEPYQSYAPHMFAIAGNHDGDNVPHPNDPPDKEASLYGFLTNFCAPVSSPVSAYRNSMTQPYVYWTLQAPFATIIGLYSNVDGFLDGKGSVLQQAWLTQQLQDADPATCIIVTVHHPPYSLDHAHGGYRPIHNAIDAAAKASGVWPHAILSGHVHDYQRFTRTIDGVGAIPYIIAGAGGYATTVGAMHKLRRPSKSNPHPCPSSTSEPDVQLAGYNEKNPGFLRLTVKADMLLIEYFVVPFSGVAPSTSFDNVVLDWRNRKVVSEGFPGTTGAV